ncbi:mRNA capping enzyme [Mucidula mucida]|nr:mRNA capping enzyme [Mucidula mucida]
MPIPDPDIPGTLVPANSQQDFFLKSTVTRLCNLNNQRFPGSQPVSFLTRDLAKLEREDYWVCEKSDGLRVLLFVCSSGGGQQDTYLINRHNEYYLQDGLFFPHHMNLKNPLGSTIVDGELVMDKDPKSGQTTLRYLAFDCLVADGQNVMPRPLDKRYGRLTEWFYKPYSQMLRDHPQMAQNQPFDIKVKQIKSSYNVEQVFTIDIPALQHGTDGLIYTCVNAPYSPGTDPNIMKWKSAYENSIDFKLELRFPPLLSDPSKPDFHAKPVFLLHQWLGGERYEQYDDMYVDDDEWEQMKLSGEQYDDRIVEVHWDPAVGHWRFMRFRDDKPHGNHQSTVEGVIASIIDGVEKDALLARSTAIRNAWKARQGTPVTAPAVKRPLGTDAISVLRYGPIATSPWSKVSGPETIAGMKR